MKGNSICAIFVTYNCNKEFYNSFNSVNDKVDKVVIVDNGSSKETIDILKDLKNKYDVEVILNKENLGIATALNKGANYAINNGYKWILTLDHDSKLTDNMLDRMLVKYNSFSSYERSKIVSIIPNYVEENLINTLGESEIKDSWSYVENGITSGNLVKTSVIKEIGFCEEKLFIDCVDSDFCCKIIKHGYNILKVDNAILIHNLGDTKIIKFFNREIKCSNHSYVRRYYITRNRLFLWNKYYNITPNYIQQDKRANYREIIKILLFEKDKILKFKMIFKGYFDYKKDIYGKINN